MDLKSLKHELQNIITGDVAKGQSYLIKTAQTYLKSSKDSGSATEAKFNSREKEERALSSFADSKKLWLYENDIGNYITEGAEQKVYFPDNENYVLKTG